MATDLTDPLRVFLVNNQWASILDGGDPPRPTALMAHIEQGHIRSAALAHMDLLDEAAVTRFVQETVAHPDIDVVGLSCLVRLAEFDENAPGKPPAMRDVVVIYLVSKERETWVANDIDASASCLMRGALDLSRGSNTFLINPMQLH